MKGASMFLGVAMLAATATSPTQCPPQTGLQNKKPPNTVVYKTQPGDSPYTLAKKFYGHGYMEYKIREANKKVPLTKGFYKPGTKILVPPDDRGRPVDITRFNRKY